MLEVFITSRVRRKVVILFTKYPDFKSHVRAIAKLIKEDAGNLQRELARLEAIGFLHSEKKKNTKLYRVNRNFLLYRELQNMVAKSQTHNRQRRTS
jgi:predicted transcriptional regulator with HTH domain